MSLPPLNGELMPRKVSLKRRPKKYPILPQQLKFLDAIEFCGIKKGISKRELQEKMRDCIPQYYKECKGNDKNLHSKTLPTLP